MKKGLCLLLSILFILSCLPMATFANELEENEDNGKLFIDLANMISII